MKEIKSNPSKIFDVYVMPSKEEIVVISTTGSKVMKLTEISIMDRQSNGSFIVKDRLIDTHKVVNLSGNDVENNCKSCRYHHS